MFETTDAAIRHDEFYPVIVKAITQEVNDNYDGDKIWTEKEIRLALVKFCQSQLDSIQTDTGWWIDHNRSAWRSSLEAIDKGA